MRYKRLLVSLAIVLSIVVALAVYHWDKPLFSSSDFLFVTVLGSFLLLLWPNPKQWRTIQHDVLKDPRSYLSILITFVVAAFALLGLRGEEDSTTLTKLTLATLAVVAFAMRWDRHRQDRLIEEIKLVSQNASAIRSFTTWHAPEVEALIVSGQESIDIVDTYFLEAEWLAPLIQRALRRGTGKLQLSIFMLHPDCGFGAQRMLEQKQERNSKSASDFSDTYEETLRTCIRLIQDNFSKFDKSKLEVTVYYYRTLLSG